MCPNGDIRLIQATNFELESCKSNSRNSSHKAPRPSNLSTPSTMSPLFPPQDIRSVSSSGYLYPSEISSLPCNYNNNVLPSYHPNQNITRSSVQDKLGEPLRTSFIKRQIIHNVEQEYKNIPVRENLKKQGLFNRTKQAINALDHKLYNDKHTERDLIIVENTKRNLGFLQKDKRRVDIARARRINEMRGKRK